MESKNPREGCEGFWLFKILGEGLVAVAISAVAAVSASATAAVAAASTTAAAAATEAASTTATAAESAATAAATTAAGTFFAWACFIDGEGAAVVLLAVEGSNRRGCFLVARHFDETEALAAAGVPVVDDLCGNHLPVLGE